MIAMNDLNSFMSQMNDRQLFHERHINNVVLGLEKLTILTNALQRDIRRLEEQLINVNLDYPSSPKRKKNDSKATPQNTNDSTTSEVEMKAIQPTFLANDPPVEVSTSSSGASTLMEHVLYLTVLSLDDWTLARLIENWYAYKLYFPGRFHSKSKSDCNGRT
jgi:hypothetical protein